MFLLRNLIKMHLCYNIKPVYKKNLLPLGQSIDHEYCGGSETPCNIARYYVMIVHCMISVLFSVYKLAYFGIQLTNTVSVFRLESSPVVTSFANFHRTQNIDIYVL